MMSFSSVLSILFVLLTIITIVGLFVFVYVYQWSIKHEKQSIRNRNGLLEQGRFLKPYIPTYIIKQHASVQIADKKEAIRIQNIKTQLIISVASVFVLAIIVGAYQSGNQLAEAIDLTVDEKRNLVTTHYDWKKRYPEQLPDLINELSRLKMHGLVLVGSQKIIADQRLNNLQKQAKASWIRFAQRYQITVRWCHWGNLSQCQRSYQNRLFVILPSYWQQDKLDSFFKAGRSVLLYGEPFQTQLLDNNKYYVLYGMQFQHFMDKSNSKLALIGDRELSLGFDAGSILDVRPASERYRVNTTRPQAVAIDINHRTGGQLKTRLYSQMIQKGRFVWMDFSPYENDHLPALNKQKFQHLIASIFRYLNKKPYQAVAMWPEGKRFAALFEHHIDADLSAVHAVKQFFKRNDYPITWSVLSNQAQENRFLTADLAILGEVACRGDSERLFTLSDALEQHERIARCQKVLSEITGQKVLTFHPPEEKFSDTTLDAMANNNIKYFITEESEDVDRFVPMIMQSTRKNKTLISIPRLAMDSDMLWGDLKAGEMLTPRLLAREVDYIENLGGLYLFSFSAEFMLKDEHFISLKQLVNDVYHKKSYLQTAAMIAKWWRLRAKIVAGKTLSSQEIKQFRPVILKVDIMGKMSSHWYKTLYATKNE